MIRAQVYPALSLVLVFALLTGGLFPLVLTQLGGLLFPHQAGGSFIESSGRIVGSELIGQTFSSAGYFHPRPSAAGAGYDPLSSGGTNLGPSSSKLIEGLPDNPHTAEVDESFAGIAGLAAAYRIENRLAPGASLPADAVTRSASGLDPHISPQNAYLQAGRIAKARGFALSAVNALIARQIEGRFLQVFGEARVNVLQLNLALDKIRR